MAKNSARLKILSRNPSRSRTRLPSISRSSALDYALGFTMATSAQTIRQMEFRFQALLSLEPARHLWETFRAFLRRPRSGISVDWFNDCPRARIKRRRTKKHGTQSLGRSRGGHSTKIHLATDALGNAIRFILTGGERNDITQAQALIENLSPEYVIADKGYDSNKFVLLLQQRQSQVVIPSKINRKIQRLIDTNLYKERHLIECCIGKLKHFRRVFCRFDKLAKNYLSFVQFASTIIWLR